MATTPSLDPMGSNLGKSVSTLGDAASRAATEASGLNSAVASVAPAPVSANIGASDGSGVKNASVFAASSATNDAQPVSFPPAAEPYSDDALKGKYAAVQIEKSVGNFFGGMFDKVGGSLGSLAGKAGAAVSSASAKASKLGKMASSAKSAVSKATSTVSSAVGKATGAASQLVHDGSSLVSGAQNAVQSEMGGLYSSVTSGILGSENSLGGIQSLIPGSGPMATAIDSATGLVIPGTPTDLPTGQLSSVWGVAKSLGCTIGSISWDSPYYKSSMLGWTLGWTNSFNWPYLFNMLTHCPTMTRQGATAIGSVVNGMLGQQKPSYASMASTGTLATPAVTQLDGNVVKTAAQDKTYSSDDLKDLGQVYDHFDITPKQVIGSDVSPLPSPTAPHTYIPISPSQISQRVIQTNRVDVNGVPDGITDLNNCFIYDGNQLSKMKRDTIVFFSQDKQLASFNDNNEISLDACYQ